MRMKFNWQCSIARLFLLGSTMLPATLALAQETPMPTAKQHLSAPIEQVAFPDALTNGQPNPRWGGDYLVSLRRENLATDTEVNLIVRDQKDAVVAQTRIWLKGASIVYLDDAVARKGGRIAAVGWAFDESGSMVSFLADVSVSSGSARIVKTSPFFSKSVTFGPDGTIWTLGAQMGPGNRSSTAPDHFIVKHFGPDDTLRGEHVLVSSLGECRINPGAESHSRIFATRDRIGIFAPSCDKWIELNASGEILGMWTLQTPLLSSSAGKGKEASVHTIVVTPDNEVYGLVLRSGGNILFHLDRQSNKWTPVDTEAVESAGLPIALLLGNDGDKIVYYVDSKLVWAKPEN